MGHLVITIGCEYGAKGNAIGRKIAEDLGIKFYDRELVDQIIEEVGIPKDIMNRVEEGGTIAGKGAEGDVRGSFSKYSARWRACDGGADVRSDPRPRCRGGASGLSARGADASRPVLRGPPLP